MMTLQLRTECRVWLTTGSPAVNSQASDVDGSDAIRVLVRAVAIHSVSHVAIMTQHSKPWWETMSFEPTQHWCSTFDRLSMLITSTVYVVYGQELEALLATALTHTSIVLEHLRPKAFMMYSCAFAVLFPFRLAHPLPSFFTLQPSFIYVTRLRAIEEIKVRYPTFRVASLSRCMRNRKRLSAEQAILRNYNHALSHRWKLLLIYSRSEQGQPVKDFFPERNVRKPVAGTVEVAYHAQQAMRVYRYNLHLYRDLHGLYFIMQGHVRSIG